MQSFAVFIKTHFKNFIFEFNQFNIRKLLQVKFTEFIQINVKIGHLSVLIVLFAYPTNQGFSLIVFDILRIHDFFNDSCDWFKTDNAQII